jgi:NADPH-dependent 2,4-dienoyl-CoA reductase/sulfur reductase-like enzyme
VPHIVVVGASLAGLRAAEQLRAHGYAGALTIVGAEPHRPYNRPPLSKEALSGHGPDVTIDELRAATAFRAKPSLDDATWLLGVPVVHARLDERTLVLDDGRTLSYDGLVVATGLRPRRLLENAPAGGRHVVRTLDDAAHLRREIPAASRAVVIGGGFIGCEVASTLHALGLDVTIVEPLPVPMVRGVGPRLGAALQEHHTAAGVQFATGQGVRALTGDSRVTGVVLDDGSELAADLVVESIGSHPNVEWLQGNGLDLTDGVLCDNHLRVEGRPDVVAAGDVARFPNPRFDDIPRRVEHWNIPGETAKRAAASLADHLAGAAEAATVFSPLPAFWSDQFGLRLQSFGAPGLADRSEVDSGSLDDLPEGVALRYLRGDRLVGTVLVNIPASAYRSYRDATAALPQPV